MYEQLKALLEAGYAVDFRPLKNGDVRLEVKEAKNGLVNGCGVDLNPMEWGWVEEGIADRLKEAFDTLALIKKQPLKQLCKNCQGKGGHTKTNNATHEEVFLKCPHCA